MFVERLNLCDLVIWWNFASDHDDKVYWKYSSRLDTTQHFIKFWFHICISSQTFLHYLWYSIVFWSLWLNIFIIEYFYSKIDDNIISMQKCYRSHNHLNWRVQFMSTILKNECCKWKILCLLINQTSIHMNWMHMLLCTMKFYNRHYLAHSIVHIIIYLYINFQPVKFI